MESGWILSWSRAMSKLQERFVPQSIVKRSMNLSKCIVTLGREATPTPEKAKELQTRSRQHAT